MLYSDPDYRPALDAWDTGAVSKGDIYRWCVAIERGMPVAAVTFEPTDAWRALLQQMTIANVSRLALQRRTQNRPTSGFRGSSDRLSRQPWRGIAVQR